MVSGRASSQSRSAGGSAERRASDAATAAAVRGRESVGRRRAVRAPGPHGRSGVARRGRLRRRRHRLPQERDPLGRRRAPGTRARWAGPTTAKWPRVCIWRASAGAAALGCSCIYPRRGPPTAAVPDGGRARHGRVCPQMATRPGALGSGARRGRRRHVVLGDAAFGDVTAFREALTARGLVSPPCPRRPRRLAAGYALRRARARQ